MWFIILFYIVIFKLPVSANMFQVRSVADMTNIHRTKALPPLLLPEPQLVLNHEPTTCVDIAGRYEGEIYKNQERICNTVQRRPGTKRQAIQTTRMLLYSRNRAQMPLRQQRRQPPGMIKPQVILPKELEHNKLRYNIPQSVAITPRQGMMHQYRASISSQRPIQGGPRQAVYHVNEGNRDYQEYQLQPQVGSPDYGNRDEQNYQSLPPAVFGINGNQQAYLQHYNPNAETKDQYLFPKAYSTSTAAPVFNQAIVPDQPPNPPPTPPPSPPPNPPPNPTTIPPSIPPPTPPPEPAPNPPPYQPPNPNTVTKSTTSTMPPFPGGFQVDVDFSGEQSQVCNGKAKCNQYVWTTRRKHAKRTTEEFLLWTP